MGIDKGVLMNGAESPDEHASITEDIKTINKTLVAHTHDGLWGKIGDLVRRQNNLEKRLATAEAIIEQWMADDASYDAAH